MTKRPTRDRKIALAYVRVSTAEQADEGASLDAQAAMLTAEAERRGWDVEVVVDAGYSAKDMSRPALQGALDRLDAGEADVLMAVRIDRVSRSVRDFSELLHRAERRRWELVMLNPSLDTTDPSGEFTTLVLAAAAQYERRLIGARTREGMAQRRAEGVHCGRPRTLPLDVVERIVRAREAGQTLRAIAEDLTAAGVPTARGGAAWRSSSVDGVLRSTTAAAVSRRTAPTTSA